MKVAGTFQFAAPRDDVYRAICDPGVLMAVIPGCESVEQVDEDTYEGRITLRLPGSTGSYRTRVRLVDADPPHRSGMEGTVEGTMGSIRGRAAFVLHETGTGTAMEYEGSGVIGGPLARLDSSFTERLAGSLITQGLRALDARLANATPQQTGPGGLRTTTEVSE
jgi:carbon monoxide dehydrogenase subunit G